MNDEIFMALALVQARQAAAAGEVPVGAVVVRGGQVIATGRNAPIGSHDPTAHAEIMALRAAALVLGNYRLDECELFVTLEPCAMCSGAMLQARLKRVIFAATEPKTGAAGSVINLFAQACLNHQTALQGGVLAPESATLLQDFFRQRRADQRDASRQRHPLRDDALRTPDAAFKGVPAYPWPAYYVSDLAALGGLRMHYLDESGQKEEDSQIPRTFLCLHDSLGWSYQYHMMIPLLLQAGHRIIVPDLIGFGKSDKPKKESFHTLSRHRQILFELVERLDLQNIVLVVQAASDMIGLSLPMAAPQRYHGLWVMKIPLASDELVFSITHPSGYVMKCQKIEPAGMLTAAAHNPSMANDQDETAVSQAPFPNAGHSAALRAFSRMQTSDKSPEDTELLRQLRQFWRERWAGEILTGAMIPNLVSP